MRQVTLLDTGEELPRYVDARPARPTHNFGREVWVDLHEYRRVLHKHLRLVVAITVVCAGFALVRDLMSQPTYTASTTLLIRNAPSLVYQNENVAMQQDSSQEQYDDTQNELLKSASLASRVILEQGLIKDDERAVGTSKAPDHGASGWRAMLANWFPGLAIKHAAPISADDDPLSSTVPRGMIDWYLGSLQVKPIENTQLVTLEFTTTDPNEAARIVNAHARAFIQRGVELNAQATDEAQKYLSTKLEELKRRVEQSELAVNSYRRDKGIIPGLISLNGNQDVVVEQLNKLDKDLQDAHLKTITLGTQIELIKAGRTDALPQVMDNKVIQNLKSELDDQESKYASMRGEYTDDYPEMRELREKIDGTRSIMDRELKTAVANVNEEYQAAVKSEQAIAAELEKQKSFALGLNDAAIKYVMLEREADTNRELYDAVLKRIKNLAVAGDAHASSVSVVDMAQPPTGPSSPRTRRDVEAGAMLGLLLGVCAALFIERLDNTLKTPEEMERYLKLPGLATIPDFTSAITVTSRYNVGYITKPELPDLTGEDVHGRDLIATYGKYSVLGESFRHLRTALRLSRAGAPPKTIMFTSAVPGEGKSTVTVNTASVFARTGSRVLIIDGDLRRPRCHRLLGLKNRAGLSEALTGGGGAELIQTTPVENLFLLSCGRIPPNPSELLGSERMRSFLQELGEQFDYVIVDSSPVLLVSDPLDLSRVVDGVVLIAAGGHTPRHQVSTALGRLESVDAKILGVVLNKVRLHKADFPHYYSKTYQGYYQGLDSGAEFDDSSLDDASSMKEFPRRENG
jgi:polysaccharide biosynthesis transport protein